MGDSRRGRTFEDGSVGPKGPLTAPSKKIAPKAPVELRKERMQRQGPFPGGRPTKFAPPDTLQIARATPNARAVERANPNAAFKRTAPPGSNAGVRTRPTVPVAQAKAKALTARKKPTGFPKPPPRR
jgi:hypothetical protein